MKKNKSKTVFLIIAAVAVLVFVYMVSAAIGKRVSYSKDLMDVKPEESFAIINIHGTIQGSGSAIARQGYDHSAIMDYVDQLIYDDSNKGIFLDVSSGGGTVYHSDEMYLKLLEYKETTGRPIMAYFGSTAASGAYYISCAADHIYANRNCWTGSIGVIISMTNFKGLYEKFGVEEILITSGANKGMGSSGSEVTEEHRAIFQSLVDDSYQTFVEIVAQSRDMDIDTVKTIADGRIYTAAQALDNGLIDEISSYDEAIEFMEELCGAQGYYRQLYIPTLFETLFSRLEDIMPKSDSQVLKNMQKNSFQGVPMYIYLPQ